MTDTLGRHVSTSKSHTVHFEPISLPFVLSCHAICPPPGPRSFVVSDQKRPDDSTASSFLKLFRNRLATSEELGAADTKDETQPSNDLHCPEIGIPDDRVASTL